MNLQFCLAFLLLIAVSCVNDDIPTASYSCSNEEIVSYSGVVDPIVKTNCVKSGCHNGDLGADKNWSVFKTFQQKNQLVKDRITRPPGVDGHMPRDGVLPYDDILSIVCWIEQGAQDN